MHFKITADLSTRKIENEIFVLNRETSCVHSFNKTGAFLWEAAAHITSSSELIKELENRFAIDHASAEKDVLEFLQTLSKNGLVIIL